MENSVIIKDEPEIIISQDEWEMIMNKKLQHDGIIIDTSSAEEIFDCNIKETRHRNGTKKFVMIKIISPKKYYSTRESKKIILDSKDLERLIKKFRNGEILNKKETFELYGSCAKKMYPQSKFEEVIFVKIFGNRGVLKTLRQKSLIA